jgi:hypothetical protein
MKKAEKVFNIIVTIVVVLTGAGFGAWAGLVYSQTFWWVGLTVGGLSAFPVAKLYLWQITKAIAEDGRKIMTWCYGAFLGALCGIICTLITHGVMLLTVHFFGHLDGLWPLVVLFGGSIGGVAGMTLGMVCTLVYVLKIKGSPGEAA